MKFLVIMFVMLASLIHIKATTITLTNNMECVNIDMPLKPFIHENFKDQYDHDGTMTINFNITNTNYTDMREISYGVNKGNIAFKFDSSNINAIYYVVGKNQIINTLKFNLNMNSNNVDTLQNFIRFFICGDTSIYYPMIIDYQFNYKFNANYEVTGGFIVLVVLGSIFIGLPMLGIFCAQIKILYNNFKKYYIDKTKIRNTCMEMGYIESQNS